MKHARWRTADQSRRQSAFTLVEVLVAIALVAVVLPIAMQAIATSISLGSHAQSLSDAAGLARSKLDELIATGDWQTKSLAGDFGSDWPEFRWTADVGNWSDASVSQIDVTVTWVRRQRESSVTMSSLVYAGASE